MRSALMFVIAAACAHPPPPAAPTGDAERPAVSVADIAGDWVSSENLDWHMNIGRDGTIDVWIDRDKSGRCEQKGTITAGKTAGQFRLLYTAGECNPQVLNVPLDATIASFTGSHLTIVVADQRREYERAAGRSDDDQERPAVLVH